MFLKMNPNLNHSVSNNPRLIGMPLKSIKSNLDYSIK